MGIDEYSILKKKPKKNAFAATSLLISIAIALLVMVGAVLVLSKVNDNDKVSTYDNGSVSESKNGSTTCEGLVKEIVFNDNLRNIKEAAINYFTNERLPQEVGESAKITLREMQNKRLLLTVRDASANSCDGNKSYVEVTKENNEYVMKILLSCSDIEDYIIVHLGCYDYCDKDVCEKEETPEKVYEYEYKKTIACTMGEWSNWGNWKTTREKTSNLKKEDIKVETTNKDTVKKIDATENVTYNCDKYPGYTLVNDKCVKEETITDTKDATPSTYSYNCDKYPGYNLVGTKCTKTTIVRDTVDATKNPTTYSCPSGYKLNGTKCERTVTKTETLTATPVCPSGYTLSGTTCTKTTKTTTTKDATPVCPSGYTRNGTKCTKTTTTTDTKLAEPVYSTRYKTQYYTCYKQECTTKTVFSCPADKGCGTYPETSCESVKKTCTKQVAEEYISDYKCDDDYTKGEDKDHNIICTKTTSKTDTQDVTYTCPDGYTRSGTTCSKTTSTTDKQTSTYSCPTGYTKNGTTCTKSYQEMESVNATANPVTYSCNKDYTLNGTKCTKEVAVYDNKNATKVDGGYICPEGYTQKDKTCTKVTVNKKTENAAKVTKYTCPEGYTKNDKTCSKKTTETIKTTYYRYATRTCDGGSTSTKWSTSKNDTILISEGYKLTGNKREIKEIVK